MCADNTVTNPFFFETKIHVYDYFILSVTILFQFEFSQGHTEGSHTYS